MKETLKPGLTHEFSYEVPPEKTVPHLYSEAVEFQEMPKVFATLDLLFLVGGKLILRLTARRVRRRGSPSGRSRT